MGRIASCKRQIAAVRRSSVIRHPFSTVFSCSVSKIGGECKANEKRGLSISGQGEDVLKPGFCLAAKIGHFDGAEDPDRQQQTDDFH